LNEQESEPGEDLLAVGRIMRPHGIRGALVVESLSDWPAERFAPGARLMLQTAPGRLRDITVVSGSAHKGRMLVTLEGVDDRESAEQLKGMFLMLPASEAAHLGEGEYWAHELVDMDVVDSEAGALGRVEDVLCREAQDLLMVRQAGGGEFGIPLVSEFIKGVDLQGRKITVRLPEGMAP
jgi:16S rRNA processing protein RimM